MRGPKGGTKYNSMKQKNERTHTHVIKADKELALRRLETGINIFKHLIILQFF